MEKWSVVQWVQEWLGSHGLGWMAGIPVLVLTLGCLVGWIIKALWRTKAGRKDFWFSAGSHAEDAKEFFQRVNAMINEAVKRAPPLEDPVDGVDFEIYRKDLLRMVDGEISLEEFVDIWRGRKVKKRPTAEEVEKAKAEAVQVPAPPHDSLRTLYLAGVFREWALHLRTNQCPLIFARMYFEWLKDPGDHALRASAAAFASFIRPRKWESVFPVLRPYITSDILAVFETEEAKKFYEQFQSEITQRIRDYWEEFILAAKAEKEPSGHVHQWTRVLDRMTCACGMSRIANPGEIQSWGDIPPRLSPTGPGGATGWSGPTGCGYIDPFPRPEYRMNQQGVVGWAQSLVLKYTPGEWVRVRRPTSPAVGLLGQISEVLGHEIRVEVHDTFGNPFFIGLSEGEFDYPPYPKEGEWWRWTKEEDGTKPFAWKPTPEQAKGLKEHYVKSIKTGLLEPVNFGKGV